eukprot:5035493-Lingulodinium_polyedra.AAC.1
MIRPRVAACPTAASAAGPSPAGPRLPDWPFIVACAGCSHWPANAMFPRPVCPASPTPSRCATPLMSVP